MENILMREPSRANIIKLIDFGLSRRLETGNQLLDARTVGKYSYIAPEVFNGEDFDGVCADIWSAAVVLFNMLTGRSLYDTPDAKDKHFCMLKADQ